MPWPGETAVSPRRTSLRSATPVPCASVAWRVSGPSPRKRNPRSVSAVDSSTTTVDSACSCVDNAGSFAPARRRRRLLRLSSPCHNFVVCLAVALTSQVMRRCVVDGATPAPQLAALNDLYNSVTNLAAAHPDWSSGDPCANNWSGVSCSSGPVAVTCVPVCVGWVIVWCDRWHHDSA